MTIENAPDEVDTAVVYVHAESGLEGMAEDWSEEPDGAIKIRINDHWLFLKDCAKKEPDAETA